MEIYRNRLWVATSDGIECISREFRYWIEMDRVSQNTVRDGITYYDWPIHIAEKECVAVLPFIEALLPALRFHARQTGVPIDGEMLARSLEYAFAYNVVAIAAGSDAPKFLLSPRLQGGI